jgi:hypothetical protein
VLGGGELGVTSTSMTTETTMPPGLTVSWQPTHTPPPVRGTARPRSPPLTLTLTVVLCPARRRPELGDTDNSWPIRPGDSVTDHDTGPPEAVSVRLAPDSALTTIVLGATRRVPGGGGGGGAVVLSAGGDGLWLGDGPWLDGRAEGAGEGPPAGVGPPATREGDTPPAALAVAGAELPWFPGAPRLPELPGVPELPGPPGGLADAVPPGEPGPAPADDVPWLSALSWSGCAPNAPVAARMTSTAAAAVPPTWTPQ